MIYDMDHQKELIEAGERKRRKEREETEERTRFGSGAPSDYGMRELRAKHVAHLLSEKAPRLTNDESLSLMLGGNVEHVTALINAPLTPAQRYEKIRDGEADYLVVGCSDSRNVRMDSEKDRIVGIFIRIAGNVVPPKGSACFDEMLEAVGNVKKDGAFIIEGHDGAAGCGAVNARVEWLEKGQPETGSEPLTTLFECVVGDSPDMNAVAQLSKAREMLNLGDRPSAAIVYDWEHDKHGHDEAIHVSNANHSDVIEILKSNWNLRHDETSGKTDLPKLLAKQRPHAVAIGASDLPFSVSTIFHAEQNEVFSTTGSEKGLDSLDMASILYAVEHLDIKHIPFVAPGNGKDVKSVMKMFDKWEKQIRETEVHGHHVLADMLDSGELMISRLMYNLETGATEQLQKDAAERARKPVAV
jgi:carbonic anhydrase